jgi:phage portal protein BeeE
MGILDRLAALFAPDPPSMLPLPAAADVGVMRALQIAPSRTGLELLGAIRTGNAPRRGTAELMLAFDRLPHLRSVVGRISQAVGQVPWRAYRVPANARASLSRSGYAARKGRAGVVAKAIDERVAVELPSHPFLDLMDRFNAEMAGVAGRKLWQTYVDLKGDCFTIVERRGGLTGDPTELWPIPPQFVTLPSKVDGPFEVSYRGARLLVPRERMLYFRDLDPHDPLSRGAGIGESLADELDADEFAGKHLKSWFLNRGIPSMLIGIEEAEEDEVRVARQDWEERNRGPMRTNRVHFHNGKLSAVRLDDTFRDQQVIDLRKFAMQVVRETYNVPPEVVGHLDNSNRATIEEALAIMAILVVQPRLELLRTEMQAQLIPLFDDGDTLVIDYDDPIPPDGKTMLDAAKAASWALSMNEWRHLQGFAPTEDGDSLHLINNALVDLESGDTNDVITLNELTLGIERLGLVGDIEGVNALRTALAARLGTTLSPIDGAEVTARPETAPEAQRAAVKFHARKALTQSDVDAIVSVIDAAVLDQHMRPVEERTVDFFGRDMTEELSKAWRPDAQDVVDFLANFSANRVRKINETTRERIRSLLIDSIAAGDRVPTIARKLREEFDGMTRGRARIIARTEVYTAANFAREQAMANEGWPMKRWVTTVDGRERRAHREMNGQTVPVGKTFVAPSGARAAYPGGFRSAALNVNCRCVVAAARDEKDYADVWRAFDRSAARHERQMNEALVRALREQERAVLSKLETVI